MSTTPASNNHYHPPHNPLEHPHHHDSLSLSITPTPPAIVTSLINNNNLRSSPSGLCTDSFSHETIFLFGCYDSILQWLQRTTDILSVLGFCVITFLKMCFAFILRYEIKEMIQKIRVLKGNAAATPATPLHELEAYLPRPSVQQESSFLINSPQTTSPFMPDARRRMTRTSGPFDVPNPLLSPPTTSTSGFTQQHRRHSSVTAITAAFQSSLTSRERSELVSPRDVREDRTTTFSNPSSSTATTVVDVNKSSVSTTDRTSSSTSSKQRSQQPPPHDIITANKTALKSAASDSSSVTKRSSDGEAKKSARSPSMV